MGERAERLRQRIELYRRYLRDGVDAALAEQYLRQIAKDVKDEAELAETDCDKRRR